MPHRTTENAPTHNTATNAGGGGVAPVSVRSSVGSPSMSGLYRRGDPVGYVPLVTPFLTRFAEMLVVRLVAEDAVEIAEIDRDRVVLFVANWLGTRARGGSLLSNVEAALLACPEVGELYADLDRLKALVDDLGEAAVR
jgi:hypothetical protein